MEKKFGISRSTAAIIIIGILGSILVFVYFKISEMPKNDTAPMDDFMYHGGGDVGTNAVEKAKLEKEKEALLEKAKAASARAVLATIFKTEQMYAMERDGNFIACTDAQLQSVLGLEYVQGVKIKNNSDWKYNVSIDKENRMEIIATRTDGPHRGKTITLDQLGNMGGTFDP